MSVPKQKAEPECLCTNQKQHLMTRCPYIYSGTVQQRREIQSKRTSEGYKPEKDEIVELRGN